MKKILLVLCAVALSAGCSYQAQRHILKEDVVGNSKIFDSSKPAVYKAFVKTVLLKNFIIKEEDELAGSILAERAVENGKRTYIVSIQARIFEDSPGKSSLFLNGSERCERMYVRDNTRFFLFIIPLPGGGGKEATSVVESVKALRDESFYQDMFAMVKANIGKAPKVKSVVPVESVKSAEEEPPVAEEENQL